MLKEKVPEISYLKGVGPKRAEAFLSLGIQRIEDLFTIYPRDYIHSIKISQLKDYVDQNVLVCGEIVEKASPRRPTHPIRIIVRDDSANMECLVWGNAFYRDKQFKIGEKYLFWGKIVLNIYDRQPQFEIRDHKKYEATDEELIKYPLIPLYILSGELRKMWVKPLTLTKIVYNALHLYSDRIKEVLTPEVIAENDLLKHKKALLGLHFPHSDEEKEKARSTLAFEELFYLQLVLALRKKNIALEEKGILFDVSTGEYEKKLKTILGFELTGAQNRVIEEILGDMRSPKPMNRLLQGDVGSGKTIVAIIAMLTAIESGYQAAFMCPTEILAEQHYKVLSGYFDALGLKCVLLVGGQKKKLRDEVLELIKSGKAQVVVGTHALIQETVKFRELGFVIIDEQHKFGVMQRAKLREKGMNPDVLVMTATPIPRTLSLTVYGDLDVSVIDELPKNRKQIKTGLRFEANRLKVYDFIRKEVKKGRQVYIVYPIIEESEKLDLKSAVSHYEILSRDVFKELRVGLVHGRMPWYEIDETIENFKDKKIDILVSTTVIEVGIDIPNATIMVIEEAQRFGLSQLHQLRGRVGRGADQSYCILMAEKMGEISTERLNIMVETTDGFKISETDMKLRGPGEFFGTRQSGELKFAVADITKDLVLIEGARKSAFNVVEQDAELREKDNTPIREHFLTYYKDSVELIKVA